MNPSCGAETASAVAVSALSEGFINNLLEPPHFMNDTMGSSHFVAHPTVPLEKIDLMVCLELVGHALGGEDLPDEVRDSLFVLGAERSEGTRDSLAPLVRAEPGLVLRPADAEIIPPLSDYLGFWDRRRPFVLLTGGRNRVYHTPQDRPEGLDFGRMKRIARWLDRFLRVQCARDTAPLVFLPQRDDLSTLESLDALLRALAPRSPLAGQGLTAVSELRAMLAADRTLPKAAHPMLDTLVAGLEQGLA